MPRADWGDRDYQKVLKSTQNFKQLSKLKNGIATSGGELDELMLLMHLNWIADSTKDKEHEWAAASLVLSVDDLLQEVKLITQL